MNPSIKVEILRAACCVAGADGLADDQERVLLKKLASEIGVGQASLEAMIERGERDHEFYRKQFDLLLGDPTEAMAILFQVALADGIINDAETEVLRGLAGNLKVPANVFEQILEKSKQIASGENGQ